MTRVKPWNHVELEKQLNGKAGINSNKQWRSKPRKNLRVSLWFWAISCLRMKWGYCGEHMNIILTKPLKVMEISTYNMGANPAPAAPYRIGSINQQTASGGSLLTGCSIPSRDDWEFHTRRTPHPQIIGLKFVWRITSESTINSRCATTAYTSWK